MKIHLFLLMLAGCQVFSGGSAKVVDSYEPYFVLECDTPDECYKFAGNYCRDILGIDQKNTFHEVQKVNTEDKKWRIELTCESGLED